METLDYFTKQLQTIGNGFIPTNIQQSAVTAIGQNQYGSCAKYIYLRLPEGKYKEWLIRLKK
jgi:hypothetical protein